MQRRPLPVVDVVHVEDVVAVVFQEGDQRAFAHLVLYQQRAQLVQRVENDLALKRAALSQL